jgi:Uma2 family endonuclease
MWPLPPNRFHQVISRNLVIILAKYLEEHPIGELYYAPFDVYLSAIDVFQPDIALILNENLSILTPAGAEGAPELIVEILSLKTKYLDLGPKRQIYAREGVRELWIVDPVPETVSIYRFDEDQEIPIRTAHANESLHSLLLPGLEIDLTQVFADRVKKSRT